MISLQELNPHNYPLDAFLTSNLNDLLGRINVVRTAYAIPMTVSSGLRSMADQMRINPKAPHSKHLTGNAVDIADPDCKLYAWCKANQDVLIKANLWLEEGTKGWVHFQNVPFGSYKPGGTHWFLP